VAAAVTCAAGVSDSSPLGVRAEVRSGADAPSCLAALEPLQPWLAWSVYDDGGIAARGFATLDSATNASAADAVAAAAAGACEGALTSVRIDEWVDNYHGGGTTYSPALATFVAANSAWARSQAAARGGADPLWHQAALLYAQLDGLVAGAHAAGARASADAIYAATLAGDLDDLCVAFGCTPSAATRGGPRGGHCSVLVKAVGAPFFSDVLAAHTTWSALETMTRIWKRQVFPFALTGAAAAQRARAAALGAPRRGAARALAATAAGAAPAGAMTWGYSPAQLAAAAAAGAVVPGASVSFSSYPGVLYSFDDFYTISPSRLVVTETTIINNNASLWAAVQPEGALLDWLRNMAANRLARSGAEWMCTFGRFNSGTYNNMFSVLDTKLFAPNSSATLAAGLLFVGEQMPGAWVFEDRTSWLLSQPGAADGPGQGYWASYNRPSFPSIFALSNQSALVAAFGDHFSWGKTARANIFRRGQAAVVDVPSLRALMRFNEFATDPLAAQGCAAGAASASNAIAERGDLTPAGARGDCCAACGLAQHDEAAIDCKHTSAAAMTEADPRAAFIAGPPTGGTGSALPPFVWSASPFAAHPHRGQPDAWNFDWHDVI
jgi:hypothetical protein